MSESYITDRKVQEKKSLTVIFSEQLRRLMTAKGVTQKVLAEAMGVQQSAVSKWLAGETIPSADNLSALADYFQVVPAELIDDGTAVAAHKPLRFADSDGAARKLDEVKRGDPERYEFLVETIETQLRKMKEKQTKRT